MKSKNPNQYNPDQYDKIAEDYAKAINPSKTQALPATLIHLTGDIKGKNVLDLACGEGFFTRFLATQHPAKIIGVDISSKLIELAKQKENTNPQNITYLAENILNLELNEHFDTITAIFLINYSRTLEELNSMCAKIYSLLKPGGIFAGFTMSPRFDDTKKSINNTVKNLSNHNPYQDGDQIEVTNISGPKPVSYTCTFWSEQTYNQAFTQAGFSQTSWQYEYIIPPEAMAEHGQEYWQKVQAGKTSAGFKCLKPAEPSA